MPKHTNTLLAATEEGNHETIKTILEAEEKFNSQDFFEALLKAAKKKDLKSVELMLEKEAQKTSKNSPSKPYLTSTQMQKVIPALASCGCKAIDLCALILQDDHHFLSIHGLYNENEKYHKKKQKPQTLDNIVNVKEGKERLQLMRMLKKYENQKQRSPSSLTIVESAHQHIETAKQLTKKYSLPFLFTYADSITFQDNLFSLLRGESKKDKTNFFETLPDELIKEITKYIGANEIKDGLLGQDPGRFHHTKSVMKLKEEEKVIA